MKPCAKAQDFTLRGAQYFTFCRAKHKLKNKPREISQDEAHRKAISEGYLPIVEEWDAEQRNIAEFIEGLIYGGVKVSTGMLRYDKRVEPGNLVKLSKLKK